MNYESIEHKLDAMQREIAELKAVKSAPRAKQGRIARIAIAAAMFLIPVVAFGVTITKPYTFVGGQPISASELNANFDTVYDRVNELGVYKVKVGSTVMGDLMGAGTGTNALSFLTEEGYLSAVVETSATTTDIGYGHVSVRYYATSDCSDNPMVPRRNKNIVFYDFTSAQLLYAMNTHPASVPGYINWSGFCQVNTQAGTQSTGDFWTTVVNDESITGVPNTISGAVTISLE